MLSMMIVLQGGGNEWVKETSIVKFWLLIGQSTYYIEIYYRAELLAAKNATQQIAPSANLSLKEKLTRELSK